MKTAYQFLNDFNGHNSECLLTGPEVIALMEKYKDQAVKQAVDLALHTAAERAYTKMHKSKNGLKLIVAPESILSLKEEVLKQLNIK